MNEKLCLSLHYDGLEAIESCQPHIWERVVWHPHIEMQCDVFTQDWLRLKPVFFARSVDRPGLTLR